MYYFSNIPFNDPLILLTSYKSPVVLAIFRVAADLSPLFW